MHRNLNPDCFLVNAVTNKVYIFNLGTCCLAEEKNVRPISNLMFSSPEILRDREEI